MARRKRGGLGLAAFGGMPYAGAAKYVQGVQHLDGGGDAGAPQAPAVFDESAIGGAAPVSYNSRGDGQSTVQNDAGRLTMSGNDKGAGAIRSTAP